MRVKIVKNGGYSGRAGTFDRGAVADVSDKLAQKLIAARIAIKADEKHAPKESITTAAFAPPETTAAEVSKPKRAPARPRKKA